MEKEFKNGRCIVCGAKVDDKPMCFRCLESHRGHFILVKTGKVFKNRPSLRKSFLSIPLNEAHSLFKAEIVEPGWGYMSPEVFKELIADLTKLGVNIERKEP